ncbi:DUF1761 family protein [Mangrovicoccus ximenensis]|uniref:DUF1761 family protein n=1 Tax=Mangrovicoccus ximenensis TaxID=1911570 RepID=UPI000D34A6B8|nr:DUF1761 family protein [Mangrovicoccus ximenensis]
MSGLTSNLALGSVAGLEGGLFFVVPWLRMLALAERRSLQLVLLDGGYAALATALMGALLVAF